MNLKSFFYVITIFCCFVSTANAEQTKTGEELAETISSINYDTDWRGKSGFATSATPCVFSMYEEEGKTILDIDENLPGQDLETLVSVYFLSKAKFIYSEPTRSSEKFTRVVGGSTKVISVEITYYDNDDDEGQRAKIELRAGKKRATCIVPGEF